MPERISAADGGSLVPSPADDPDSGDLDLGRFEPRRQTSVDIRVDKLVIIDIQYGALLSLLGRNTSREERVEVRSRSWPAPLDPEAVMGARPGEVDLAGAHRVVGALHAERAD